MGWIIIGVGAGAVTAIVYSMTGDMDKRGRYVACVIAGCVAAVVLSLIFG